MRRGLYRAQLTRADNAVNAIIRPQSPSEVAGGGALAFISRVAAVVLLAFGPSHNVRAAEATLDAAPPFDGPEGWTLADSQTGWAVGAETFVAAPATATLRKADLDALREHGRFGAAAASAASAFADNLTGPRQRAATTSDQPRTDAATIKRALWRLLRPSLWGQVQSGGEARSRRAPHPLADRNRDGARLQQAIDHVGAGLSDAGLTSISTAAEVDISGGDASSLTPLVAPLIFNKANLGDIEVEVDGNGRGQVSVARFLELIQPLIAPESFDRIRAAAGGRARAPFNFIDPTVAQLTFDSGALELQFSIGVDQTAVTKLALIEDGMPRLNQMARQAGLATSLTAAIQQTFSHTGSQRGAGPMRGELEGFMSLGGFTGLTTQFGALWDQSNRQDPWQRTPVRMTRDWFNGATRATFGEFNPAVSGFQGSTWLFGLSFARDFANIRPFQNVRPAGRSAITLDRAATVIVEVNGIEARRLDLGPGRYELSDFAARFGANNVRLLVEDLAGRREVTEFSFFSAQSLLQPGVSEFAASIGAPQTSNGGGSAAYQSEIGFSGYYRRGINTFLTAGLGAQAYDGGSQVSIELASGSDLGVVRFSLAGSEVDRRSGSAAALDLRREFTLGKTANFVAATSVQARSAQFQSPFSRLSQPNEERWRSDTRLELRLPGASFATTIATIDRRNRPRGRLVDLSYSANWRDLSWNVAIGAEEKDDRKPEVYLTLGLGYRIGARNNATYRYDGREGGQQALEFARNQVAALNDVSGRMSVRRSRAATETGFDIGYLNNRFDAAYSFAGAQPTTAGSADRADSRLRIATGLGFADGAIGWGRPTNGGFLIATAHETLGKTQVTVADEGGRVIARNGWFGPAVASLTNNPYLKRTLLLDAAPTPAGYDLGNVGPQLFPSPGAGFKVVLGSNDSRSVVGYLVSQDEPIGEKVFLLTRVDDPSFAPRSIFTNSAGRFVADRLAPGKYAVSIGAQIMATFVITDKQMGFVDVGILNTDPS